MLTTLLFIGCSEDDIINQELQSETTTTHFLKGIHSREINLQDLQQDNEDFHTILESSIAQKNAFSEKQRSSRSINPEDLSQLYDIELEDHVLELKTDDYISYTIPVKQQEGAEYLQNIVVEEDAVRRSVVLMRYELSNRTTNSSRSLSGLSSPTSPSQLTGSASKEYLSYEEKAEIENSFVCTVVVYVPGRNCTAGDNHTVGESCVGEGDERATAGEFQTYHYSCPDDLGPEGTGGGSSGPSGISDNGGANSGGGVATSESLTLNEIAARYGGSVKVCLIKDAQGKCLEWFDYTPNPTLTMPLGYKKFSRKEIEIIASIQKQKAPDYHGQRILCPAGYYTSMHIDAATIENSKGQTIAFITPDEQFFYWNDWGHNYFKEGIAINANSYSWYVEDKINREEQPWSWGLYLSAYDAGGATLDFIENPANSAKNFAIGMKKIITLDFDVEKTWKRILKADKTDVSYVVSSVALAYVSGPKGNGLVSTSSDVKVLQKVMDDFGPLTKQRKLHWDDLFEAFTWQKIGSTGFIGEYALKKLGGVSQKSFQTSLGIRYVDQFVDGIAHEAKVGYQSLTPTITKQIAKDALIVSKRINNTKGATWHFFKSPVTGRVGGSAPLLRELTKNNILYIIHD